MLLSQRVKDRNRQVIGTVVFLSHSEHGGTAYLRVVADGTEHLFEIPWHLLVTNYRSHCFTLRMSKEELFESLDVTAADPDALHGVC
jgi:hypothetical protein